MTTPEERRPAPPDDDDDGQAAQQARRDAREEQDTGTPGQDDPEKTLLDGEPDQRLAEESDEGRSLAQDVRSDSYDDESHERR